MTNAEIARRGLGLLLAALGGIGLIALGLLLLALNKAIGKQPLGPGDKSRTKKFANVVAVMMFFSGSIGGVGVLLMLM